MPECWAVIRPLLCSVYLPKCEQERVSKVPYQLCIALKKPCRFVNSTEWPDFLQCQNSSVFTTPKTNEGCMDREFNKPRKLEFNTTGSCLKPELSETNEPLAQRFNIDGCGLSCNDPRYTANDRSKMKGWIKVLFTICIVVNLICLFSDIIIIIYRIIINKNTGETPDKSLSFHAALNIKICYVMIR